MISIEQVITPEVVIIKPYLLANIERVPARLKEHGINHRPHVKSHKSIRIAKMQIESGAIGITCSGIGEAEVMAKGGIDDILIAYPVIGKTNIERLTALIPLVKRLSLSVNSYQGLDSIISAAEKTSAILNIYLEVDVGTHRGEINNLDLLYSLATKVVNHPQLHLQALQSYAGIGYSLATDRERRIMIRECCQKLIDWQSYLAERGINVPELSAGSSLEACYPEELKGITELRAGNYVFGDLSLLNLGLITEEQCALRVISQVIALYKPGQAIIDAGSKTLTSDLSSFSTGYGKVISLSNAQLFKLNEEHGFLKYDPEITLEIGDLVEIIANHCCVLPNLCDSLPLIDKQQIVDRIIIDARGMTK